MRSRAALRGNLASLNDAPAPGRNGRRRAAWEQAAVASSMVTCWLSAAVHESGNGTSRPCLKNSFPQCLDFVAKLDDKPSAGNNRIVANKFLNQHCALGSVLESILLVLAPK